MTPEQAEIAKQCAAIAAQFDQTASGHIVIILTVVANIVMLIRVWRNTLISMRAIKSVERRVNGS